MPISTRPNEQDATKYAQPRTPAGRQSNHADDERTTSDQAVRETDLWSQLGTVPVHRTVGSRAVSGTFRLADSALGRGHRLVHRFHDGAASDYKAYPLLPCRVSCILRAAGTL